MRTRYSPLSPPEKGKHSPKGEILVAEVDKTTSSLREALLACISGVASYMPWIALSAILTLAAIVVLNSGMSLSDITHLLVPTSCSIGELVA